METEAGALENGCYASVSVVVKVVFDGLVASTNCHSFLSECGSFLTWLSLCPFL